jgi:hypothetical protein
VLKYTPYVGVEYLNNLAVESGGSVVAPFYTGSLLTLRLYTEIFPLMARIPGENRLVATAEVNSRHSMSGTIVDGALNAVTVSVDFYFDQSQRFAVGVTHDRGEFPKANFVDQRRTSLSFRVKL